MDEVGAELATRLQLGGDRLQEGIPALDRKRPGGGQYSVGTTQCIGEFARQSTRSVRAFGQRQGEHPFAA
jgi:hypothetical protein